MTRTWADQVDSVAADTLALLLDVDPLDDELEGISGWEHRLPDPDRQSDATLRDQALALRQRCASLGGAASDDLTVAVAAGQVEGVLTRLDAALVEHTVCDYDASPLGRLLGRLPQVQPADPGAEAALLERLASVAGYLDRATNRQRHGCAAGQTPVARQVTRAVARLDGYLGGAGPDALEAAVLTGPAVAARRRLTTGAIRPALAAYRQFLVTELAPLARPDSESGLCWLPGGDEAYQGLVRMHTTTSHSAAQLHELGRDTVAGLNARLADLGSRVLGTAGADQARDRLRTDANLRWPAPRAVADGALGEVARAALERARQRLPDWFAAVALPQCRVDVTAEPGAPPGYYLPPAVDGTRPGTYVVNAHRAAERGRYLAEATAFHETVPGHHLQFAVAQNRADLPLLRRVAKVTAYVEGWGLYAEHLAEEMGLYSEDEMRLGMIALDLVRAARLVVDTGLHAFGWSRSQVVAYLTRHTTLGPVEVETETDRYVELPGQALSYLTGRLEMDRMRARAERDLGAGFDIRGFHDAILGSGPLPMAVLDGVVDRWIHDTAAATAVVPIVVSDSRQTATNTAW